MIGSGDDELKLGDRWTIKQSTPGKAVWSARQRPVDEDLGVSLFPDPTVMIYFFVSSVSVS